MAIERIVDNQTNDDEQHDNDFEETLRPKDFKNYVGQEKLKKGLHLAIEAAKGRNDPIDHVLLYGPPGLGKTTMAGVISSEMGTNLRSTSGPAIERAGDLASLLTNLEDGDILFIDEIHRLPRTVEEVLYPAMEDFHIDIMLGKGPSARSMRLDVPKITIIGATTRVGALTAPLRDRFGLVHRLEFYEQNEIVKILQRSARILGTSIDKDAAAEVALRSRLTPRIANRLLKRVRDYAEVKREGHIDKKTAQLALDMLEIDDKGLDNTDRNLLKAIIEKFNGGPVGVDTIAALISEEKGTIEDVYEPYLMQIGFLERTPRGRRISRLAYKHLGIELDDKKDQEKLI